MEHIEPRGRIGPNAVIRLAEALRLLAPLQLEEVFAAAGLADWAHHPPREMVPETDVCRLHAALRGLVGEARARDISRRAGHLTGDYLLQYRIPPAARRVFHLLPRPIASGMLVAAIRRNAWTFAGTGTLQVAGWRPLALEIADCPLCRGHRTQSPCCGFYAATFEQLFRSLVAPDFRFEETACMALGAPSCRFEAIC